MSSITLVRQFTREFEMDVDFPDKTLILARYVAWWLSFEFLLGTATSRHKIVAILDFQDGRLARTYFYQYLVFYAI